MMTRSEIAQRKTDLLQDLRASYRAGQGMPGGGSINQRELSVRYGLSIRTVSIALKDLAQEGVLYTVPRVGTFLGRLPSDTVEPYLFVAHPSRATHVFVDQTQTGFEDRIAHLGGASLTLATEETTWPPAPGDVPPLSGLFHYGAETYHASPDRESVPHVFFRSQHGLDLAGDVVDFDDEDGGVQATRHLLTMGHREIAFLALHSPDVELDALSWSRQREAGWKSMMQDAGQATHGLAFHPSTASSATVHNQHSTAREIAVELIKKPQVTAVIAVNAYAANGLLWALAHSGMPTEKWPAIVCFDDTPNVNSAGISYLRLPWEKIGAEAAQLLWERKTGRLTGPPQRRLVKMHLIRRLTCRMEWARSSGVVNQQAINQRTMNSHAAELGNDRQLKVAGI